MRTIDGIRLISPKEYAEMKGISVSRVSQMKNDLPYVKIEEFGIELINLDLLDLQEEEKALAIAKFESATKVLHPSLSYKDLGTFLSKFIHDLVTFRGSAEMLISDLQDENKVYAHKLAVCQEAIASIQSELKLSTDALNWANLEIEKIRASEQLMQANVDGLTAQNETLNAQLQSQSKELADLNVINDAQEKTLAQKAVEAAAATAEIEKLKIKIASMEALAKAEKSFEERFAILEKHIYGMMPK